MCKALICKEQPRHTLEQANNLWPHSHTLLSYPAPFALLCFSLQADFGVVVGSSGLLRRVCRKFGVTLLPLTAAPLSLPTPQGARGRRVDLSFAERAGEIKQACNPLNS